MNYGFTYQGSKNRLAEHIIAELPPAKYFVDLFTGGGAVTHCAMLSNKFDKFIMNDYLGTTKMFENAMHGVYRYSYDLVKREEFFDNYKTNLFIRYCWSFSCIGRTYVWSKAKENYCYKHYNDVLCKKLKNQYIKAPICKINRVNELYKLNKFLSRTQFLQRDFENVEIPKNSVVYCDPPYGNTRLDGYNIKGCSKMNEYNFQRFTNFLLKNQGKQIYISEYKDIPHTVKIKEFEHRNNIGNRKKTKECLYKLVL